jgi:hypothetical protein
MGVIEPFGDGDNWRRQVNYFILFLNKKKPFTCSNG